MKEEGKRERFRREGYRENIERIGKGKSEAQTEKETVVKR